MHMTHRTATFFGLLLTLTSLGATAGCGRAEGAAPRPEAGASAQAVLVGRDGERSFWWKHLTEDSSALVWFGPVLLDGAGREWRHWVASCARPNTDQPWVWFQSGFRLDSSDHVGLSGEGFTLRLEPHAGSGWRDVQGPQDLHVEIDGFD